ncbi:30S ribosomal protein S6 [Marinivivus vitaminiproducens]|uniref:30S ribosomal protein S6 n=1 Tax=Marinivivus vitaminiproducens TaxID=3035935 RepID=UPI00279F9F17|nr:30S ribosomal protein S6 [Geminicoccaceae bacterium SCSIO 64248]
MPLYEHTVIARQDLTAQQAQALAESFSEIVSAQGGAVAKTEYWGLRSLTYRIKKNRKGHYLHLNLDAPAAAVKELERVEGINDDVLRVLTVRVEAHEDGPSVVMQVRSSREERSGRRDGPGGDRDRGDRERGDRDRGDRDRGDRGERRADSGGGESRRPAN